MATRRSDNELSDTEALFAQYASSRDRSLRERLILEHLGLVRRLLRQVRRQAALDEDLLQVGYVGLIKAIDRYDPGYGNGFISYATPTVLGEVRRYVRDRGRLIRLPRHVQEQQSSARRTCDRLTQELGRQPTDEELSKALGESTDALVQAEAAAVPLSLDQADADRVDGDRPRPIDVGEIDDRIERAENRYDLTQALNALSARERAIMCFYFFGEMTQAEIAGRLRLSQMHVSRLHRSALRQLRGGISVQPESQEVESSDK